MKNLVWIIILMSLAGSGWAGQPEKAGNPSLTASPVAPEATSTATATETATPTETPTPAPHHHRHHKKKVQNPVSAPD